MQTQFESPNHPEPPLLLQIVPPPLSQEITLFFPRDGSMMFPEAVALLGNACSPRPTQKASRLLSRVK